MASSKLMVISEDSGNISKWKIVLAVGGAAVLGLGVYYFLTMKRKKSKAEKSGSNFSSGKKTNGTVTKEAEDNSPLGKAKQFKVDGNTFFKKGDYDSAIKCYDEAIQLCPDTSTTDLAMFYQNRAAAYEHKKEWANVVKDCSKAIELNSRYIKALQRRARAAENLDDLKTSLEDYTAICILESFGNPESLNVIDTLLKKIGLKRALEFYYQRPTVVPSKFAVQSYMNGYFNDPVWNQVLYRRNESGIEDEKGFFKALQLMRDQQYSEVIQCCTDELDDSESEYKDWALLLRASMRIISLDTNGAREDFKKLMNAKGVQEQIQHAAHVKLGSLEASANNVEEAMALFNQLLDINPNNADIYHQVGQIHLLGNKVELAIENFNKVVELEPDFAIGYVQKLHTDFRYATFKGEKVKAESIVEEFKKASERFPKCVEIYFLLANILIDMDKYEEAQGQFDLLDKVTPDSPVGLVSRGMLQLQWKGDMEGAKTLMRKALEVDPQCEMALENLASMAVQSGELEEGAKLFDRVIPLAKSVSEMSHYFSLRDAALAQIEVVKRLKIVLPSMSS